MDLSMEVKTRWQDNIYPLCSCVEFLEGEQRDTQTLMEWNKHWPKLLALVTSNDNQQWFDKKLTTMVGVISA
jgi:hypothetical protein